MSIYEDSPEPGPSGSCSESSNSENVPPSRRTREDGFDWDEFLEDAGCHPSNVLALWPHCTFMEKQIFEIIFSKGLMLFVEKNGTIRPATIVLSLGLECNVEYQDVAHSDSDWVTLENIVTDPNRALELQKEILMQVNAELSFVNMNEVCQYKDSIDQQLYTLIQPGQYFELRDHNDPAVMFIVKVVSNHCGIIVYVTMQGESGLQCINLVDRRCYPLGWTLQNKKECRYHQTCANVDIHEIFDQRVPTICFGSFGPDPHNFQKGNLIEVLDGNTGLFTCPAHISDIVCSKYAVADVYTNCDVEPEKILVTKNTPGIYPQDFSHRNRLHMQTPLFLSSQDIKFTWTAFKNALKIPKATSALENTLNQPNYQKIYCQQYVEYFNYELGIMTPALIVRSKMDSIWLVTGLNKSAAQAIHCFVGSTSIYPVRFADKYKTPFCATPDPPQYFPEKPDSQEQSRFMLDRFFKPIPGPIFRKPQYCGRGRPEKTWHFMTDWNLRGDNWVPEVKIVRTCRLGPWLDPKAFAGLRDAFPFGNLQDAVECIVKDFLRCTKPEYRADVISTFDVSDVTQVMPKQVIKFRGKSDSWLLTMAACETCESFPGWLRTFLECYGCCPNLLTFNTRLQCEEGCDAVVDPIVMPTAHASGKRSATAEGPTKRRRGGKEQSKPSRTPQNSFGNSDQPSTSGRGQRLIGALDVPEYTTWTKVQLSQYLLDQNPQIKIQLKQLFSKATSVSEILQCRDAMSVARLGFKPKDAQKIAEALDSLRVAYR